MSLFSLNSLLYPTKALKITCSTKSCFCVIIKTLFPTVSVAPDTINNHVKTCREEQKSLHFFAPEYGGKILSFDSDTALFYNVFSDIDQLNSAFSRCQCYHSRGYLFLWNVRLRGERSLVLL